MSFYIAIIAFITSVIAGLILMIIAKNPSKEKFMLLASLHGILLLAFIASLILRIDPNAFNYFFMVFICSGIVLSGIVWRTDVAKAIKYYFSLFILTIGMFLLSPSMLVNFLLTTKYSSASGESFLVQENFYIERQNTTMKSDDMPYYKLIRKRGIFHTTIQRDISFNGKLDSIKVLDFNKQENGLIRGYTSKKTFVSSSSDSLDVEIILKKKSVDGVEYKL
jgi:hypothetical protein